MSIDGLSIQEQIEILNRIDILQNLRKIYNKNHRVCPRCKQRSYTTTLVSFPIYENDFKSYKDLNEVKCICGFNGIVHDLISK